MSTDPTDRPAAEDVPQQVTETAREPLRFARPRSLPAIPTRNACSQLERFLTGAQSLPGNPRMEVVRREEHGWIMRVALDSNGACPLCRERGTCPTGAFFAVTTSLRHALQVHAWCAGNDDCEQLLSVPRGGHDDTMPEHVALYEAFFGSVASEEWLVQFEPETDPSGELMAAARGGRPFAGFATHYVRSVRVEDDSAFPQALHAVQLDRQNRHVMALRAGTGAGKGKCLTQALKHYYETAQPGLLPRILFLTPFTCCNKEQECKLLQSFEASQVCYLPEAGIRCKDGRLDVGKDFGTIHVTTWDSLAKLYGLRQRWATLQAMAAGGSLTDREDAEEYAHMQQHREHSLFAPYDILLLDELEASGEYITSEKAPLKVGNRHKRAYAVFQQLMAEAPLVVAMDAQLSDESLHFLSALAGEECRRDLFVYEDRESLAAEERTCHVTHDQEQLEQAVKQRLQRGKPTLCHFARKGQCDAFHEQLRSLLGEGHAKLYHKGTMPWKETREELRQCNETWSAEETLSVCATSAVSVGTSFVGDKFDTAALWGDSAGPTARIRAQMVRRGRQARKLQAWLPLDPPGWEPETIEELKKRLIKNFHWIDDPLPIYLCRGMGVAPDGTHYDVVELNEKEPLLRFYVHKRLEANHSANRLLEVRPRALQSNEHLHSRVPQRTLAYLAEEGYHIFLPPPAVGHQRGCNKESTANESKTTTPFSRIKPLTAAEYHVITSRPDKQLTRQEHEQVVKARFVCYFGLRPERSSTRLADQFFRENFGEEADLPEACTKQGEFAVLLLPPKQLDRLNAEQFHATSRALQGVFHFCKERRVAFFKLLGAFGWQTLAEAYQRPVQTVAKEKLSTSVASEVPSVQKLRELFALDARWIWKRPDTYGQLAKLVIKVAAFYGIKPVEHKRQHVRQAGKDTQVNTYQLDTLTPYACCFFYQQRLQEQQPCQQSEHRQQHQQQGKRKREEEAPAFLTFLHGDPISWTIHRADLSSAGFLGTELTAQDFTFLPLFSTQSTCQLSV